MRIGRSVGQQQVLRDILRDVRSNHWASLDASDRAIVSAYATGASMTAVAADVGFSVSGIKRRIERLLRRYTDTNPAIGAVIRRRDSEAVMLLDLPPEDAGAIAGIGRLLIRWLADSRVRSVQLSKPGDSVVDHRGQRYVLDEQGRWLAPGQEAGP